MSHASNVSKWLGSMMGTTATRYWEFDTGGATHVVELTHDSVTGHRKAVLDGLTIFEGTEFPDRAGTIEFPVVGKAARILISYPGKPMASSILMIPEYHFEYDGKQHDDQLATATSSGCNLSLEHYRAAIPRSKIVTHAAAEVVFYELVVTIPAESGKAEQTHTMEKRFSDFAALHEKIAQGMRGSKAVKHLLLSLPALPSKKWKLLISHSAPEFAEQRRCDLQVYFQKLLGVPRVARNADLRRFLGLFSARSDTDGSSCKQIEFRRPLNRATCTVAQPARCRV